MKDHLKFCMCLLAFVLNDGSDPFGRYASFPWNEKQDAVERAKDKMDAAFEFITKTGLYRTIVFTMWMWWTIPMM